MRVSTGLAPHPSSYWAATAGAPPPALPLAADRSAEVAVVGGGYTGLAAAHRLAGTYSVETVVLEARRTGWGASGRNGGFAMPGLGKLDLAARIARWGPVAARRSLEVEVEAVAAVRVLLEAEGIDAEAQAPGYLYVAHRADRLRGLHEEARLYAEVGGPPALEVLDGAALEARGFLRGRTAHGGLRNPHAFGLHPLRYVHGLAAAAARRGATLHEGTPVMGWRRLPDGRLLYGGRGGVIDSEARAGVRKAWLLRQIRARFPDLPPLEAEWFWYGNVCLPYDLTPHVRTVEDDPTVAYAMGYTGTGVALATYAGRLVADLVAGRGVPLDTPFTARGLPRFPLPLLRRLDLAAAYADDGVKDRMP